jgi:hypothetical protein
MSALSRRAALAAPAALVVAPALPASAAQPDAEVIRLAAEVIRLQTALVATHEPPARTVEEERAREPEQRRLAGLLDEAADALAVLAPCTLAGFVAKARAAFALADQSIEGELQAHGIDDLLTLALVEDLARLGGPLAPLRMGEAEAAAG